MDILTRATMAEFSKAFDNGGYFWNLWTHAGDGVISTGEIAKAGQAFAADRVAILRFELMRGCLEPADAEKVLSSLDKKAAARWKKHEPVRCAPYEALSQPVGTGVIIEAVPEAGDDSEGEGISITGMMLIGKAVVPVISPITHAHRLWRLDEGNRIGYATLLAVTPKTLEIGLRPWAIGALVHESSGGLSDEEPKRKCLMGMVACPL